MITGLTTCQVPVSDNPWLLEAGVISKGDTMKKLLNGYELRIVLWLANGLTHKQIADKLGTTTAAITESLSRSRKKIKVKTNIHLVAVSIKNGWLRYNQILHGDDLVCEWRQNIKKIMKLTVLMAVLLPPAFQLQDESRVRRSSKVTSSRCIRTLRETV